MIFTTKNKELAIFGKTIAETKRILIDFFEAFERGGFRGESGIIDTFFSKNKNSLLTPELLDNFELFKEAFNSSSLSAEAVAEKIENVDKRILNYAKTCKNGEMTTKGFKASLNSMSISAKAGAVAFKILATAGNIVTGVLISMVFDKIFQSIDNYIHKTEKAKEALDDFYNTSNNAKNNLDSQQDWIEKNGKSYEKLAKGVDEYGHAISLTVDEFSEYKTLTKEIAEMFPNMVKGYNDQNEAILRNKGNVDTLTEAYEKNTKAYYASIRAKSGEIFSDYQTEIEIEAKKTNTLNDLINNRNIDIKHLIGNNGMFYAGYGDILDKDTYKQLKKEMEDKFVKDNGLFKTFEEFDFSKLSPELRQKIIDIYNTANTIIDTETEKVRPILEAYLYSASSEYASLDENAKQAVQTFINNMDSTFYSQFGKESDLEAWIKENIIKPLQDGADSSDVAIRFQTLFSLNEDDFDSYQNYINAVRNILNALSNITGKNGKKLFSQEQIDSFSLDMGMSTYDTDGSVTGQKLIDTVKKKFNKVKNAGDFIDKLSKKELQILYSFESDETTSLAKLKSFIKNKLNSEEKSKNLSFNEVWNSLDTTNDSSLENLKQNLLELAMQGNLTAKTFSETSGADSFLKQIGISAKQAKTAVQNLLTTQQKLNAFSQGINSLTIAFQEFKDNQFVSAQTLDAMPDAFKSLKGFDLFSQIVGDPTNGKEKIKKAFNEIIQEYIEDQNTLVGVTEKNKNTVIANLEKAGIINAEEIVNNYIHSTNTTKKLIYKAEAELYSQTAEQRKIDLLNFQKALQAKNLSFADACKTLGVNNANLMNALGQNYATDYINWVELCNKKIDTYNKMVTAMNIAMDSSPGLNPSLTFKKETGMTPEEYIKNVKLTSKDKRNPMKSQKLKYYLAALAIIDNKKANNEEAKAQKNLSRYKTTDINFDTETYNPTKANNSTTNPVSGTTTIKESKQIIDWLERRFKRMQDIIDLTASKLQNLFSIKAKSSNLDKQIKQTTKLIRQYSVAISKYKAKAKAASKGLPKDIKSKVKSSEVTKKSYKKLVKTYGQEKADKIQNYIDWYDKWQAAKQSREEQKANKRNLKKEKNQLYVDRADSKLSMLDAQAENVRDKEGEKTADEVNTLLQKKVKWTKQYYDYQIKNAKLEKDSAKEAELRAQKEKALRDIKVEKHQNRIDAAEAKYNLSQQRETNATDAKTKNKYEVESLKYLEIQYKHLIEIAKLEGDVTEQKRLQAEKQEKIAESYKKMYDNIKTEYENQTSLNDAQIATVQAQIATLEASGKSATKEIYNDMMKISSDTTQKLLKERAELEKAGKNFEYSSQEWYDWQNDLLSIDQQLESSTQQLIEFQKAINELDLKKFSLIAAQLESANNQIDFLTSMLSHKDLTSKEAAGLTDEGLTTISLWMDKMENNKKIIENAQNAMAEYQKQMAEGTTGDNFETQNQTLQEFTKTIQDAALADEDLKDSIINLVEEAFNVQLDVLNELIEKRKKALQTEKNLYDYQRKVASQTKTIASIQKQIAALTGDHSEEARAKLQKLKVNLEEAQQDLKDTEYDKWLSDQEDMLDSMAEEMENFFDNALQNTDSLISAATKAVNENGAVIVDTLKELGYGDAHSFDTKDNGNGTFTSYYTDYNGNQIQITSDQYGNIVKDTAKPDPFASAIESAQNFRDSAERNPQTISWNPLSAAAGKGHMADRTNASIVENKNADNSSVILQRRDSILTPEQTEQFKNFLGITPPANGMAEKMAKMTQPPTVSSTINKPRNVNVGGVTIHLDGSRIIDEQSFVDTLKHSTMIQSAIDESVAKGVTKTYSNTLGRF